MNKKLDDFPFIKKDENAKSLSYFFTSELAFVNKEIIELLENSVINEKENVRISLHSSAENSFHNMIIAQGDFTYNRPHKHLKKAETYHILSGKQLVVIFDDNGLIREKFVMSKEENMIYRFEKNIYHMTIPLSFCCVFHESKIGPFIREGDSIFAKWAPEDGEHKKFMSNMLEGIQ